MTESATPSCARAALFDPSHREASRPCAAECEPLAHDPTNCGADSSRRRALALGTAAQTMVAVLGTRFGAQNYEIPLRRRMPRCLVRALLCSARHSAMRRGIVWPSVNPGRAATRIAAQMLAVGACSRGFLMHKQWSPF